MKILQCKNHTIRFAKFCELFFENMQKTYKLNKIRKFFYKISQLNITKPIIKNLIDFIASKMPKEYLPQPFIHLFFAINDRTSHERTR